MIQPYGLVSLSIEILLANYATLETFKKFFIIIMKHLIASLKRFIRRHPSLYFTLCGWKPSVRRLRGRPDSQLILEGYPRSANTSSMYALYYAQGSDFTVGHHLHVPAHIKYAVQHKLPCLVIMREPLDCVASLLLMRGGGDSRVLLLDYIDFAAAAIDACKHIIIVSFKDVISQGMGFAIQRLNQRFGTDFKEPDGSEEEQAWVKDQILNLNRQYGGDQDRLSLPTEAKREKVGRIKEQVRTNSDLLSEADRLYHLAVEKGVSF
jgi:hypothetical protein